MSRHIKIKLYIDIDKWGIWRLWKGDEICWIWPWKRKDGNKYISTCCEGKFKSKKEMKKFWNEYFNKGGI